MNATPPRLANIGKSTMTRSDYCLLARALAYSALQVGALLFLFPLLKFLGVLS